jgi:hypothetical protein
LSGSTAKVAERKREQHRDHGDVPGHRREQSGGEEAAEHRPDHPLHTALERRDDVRAQDDRDRDVDPEAALDVQQRGDGQPARQREREAEAVAQQHRIGTELGAQDGEPGVRQGRPMEALAPADRRAVAPGARRAPRQADGLVEERGALAQRELDAAEGDDGADVVGTGGDAGALVDDGRVELLQRALERLSVRAYTTRVSGKGPHGPHVRRHGLDGASGAAAQRLGPLE